MHEDTDTDNRYVTHNSEFINSIEDIENEIYYDLKNISAGDLYKKDNFKKSGHNIDIISPREVIPGSRSVINDPDTVRFMLSLYPYKSDLIKVQTIVLQPKHIEVNGIELTGLYIAADKLLILYMHSPLLLNSNDDIFNNFSKILSYALGSYFHNNLYMNNNSADFFGIPLLWYVLSTITLSTENKIEKFFTRMDNTKSGNLLHKLSDVSFHYLQLGY